MDAVTLAQKVKDELRRRVPHALWAVTPVEVETRRGLKHTELRIEIKLEIGEVMYTGIRHINLGWAENPVMANTLPAFMLDTIMQQLIVE